MDNLDHEFDENYMGTKLGSEMHHDLIVPLEGDILKGKVAKIDDDVVYVDIRSKAESLVKREEFPEDVKIDDEFEFVVIKGEDEEGNAVLSKRLADVSKIWDVLDNAFKTKTILREKVTQVVKGGLIVDLSGIRGFMPASQIDFERIDNLYPFVDEEVPFLVIEFDRESKKVILSRKEALAIDREKKKGEMLDSIKPGSVVDGKVVRLTKYGAFVDLGGIDGLVHVSEMSWARIRNPQEAVKEGDEVKVKILSVSKEDGRISLSIKQTQENPWDKARDLFKEGEILKGTVARTVSFGAFVRIHPDFEGLVHISEIAPEPVRTVEDALQEGQEIEVKILKVDTRERKIALSIKRVKEDIDKQEYSKFINEHKAVAGIRLGDLLQEKLDELK